MFTLLSYRILVLPDEGENDRGVIFQHNLREFRCLTSSGVPIDPEDPEQGMTDDIYHDHVVFVSEGTVEVEIGGVTYLAMHIDNIVGYLTD